MIYVLERVIVESASLANIILTKPQLSEQALSLLTLLEPIPPHVCLSTRRVAAVFYLLPSLYPSLTTPTRWSHIFNRRTPRTSWRVRSSGRRSVDCWRRRRFR